MEPLEERPSRGIPRKVIWMNSSSSNTEAAQARLDTTTGSPVALSGIATLAVALLALLLAAFTVIQNASGGFDTSSKTSSSPASLEQVAEPQLTVEEGGPLRDLVAEEDKPQFDQYMADPENRTEFILAFQAGIDQAQGKTETQTNTPGNAQNILAYGFDRDHVWVAASYAEMARGLIWGAVQYCKRYVPGWVCDAGGRWLSSMAQGYAPMSNHGVWGALYWNRYTGGRW